MNEAIKPPFQKLIKDKLIALLIHVGASLPVYIVLLLLVRFVWYPDFYYDILVIQPILVTLFLVDVVLGPLLTFVIYKKNKPKLIFDIGVIVLFQLSAFVYGLSIVYKERPLYMVYTIDRFVVVTANSINTDDLIYPELKKKLPAVVASDLPESEEERQSLLWSVMEGGSDIEYITRLYRPMEKVKNTLLKNGMPLSELPEKIINEIETKWPDDINNNLKAYPMIPTKSADQLLIWNVDEQRMVGLIKKDPWGIIKKI